uniref:Immunoglobulin V-set domain-containing protein n=1 Tax=Pygocentrus nattereri TaxID=42514 RepID=A0AAR2KTC6_PYGNA
MCSSFTISLYFLALWSQASLGIITVDQSPPVISVQPHDTVKILCRASRDIGNDMELYQLKPGQAPKHLIHDSTRRMSGVPERFSGSYTGALTTFTISSVQLEDEAEYHCAHSEEFPITQ